MAWWRLAILVVAIPAMVAATKPSFTYVYPAQARAIPALRSRLDADARQLRADYDSGQTEDRAWKAKEGYDFNWWTADYDWKVVTDTPRFLSLSESQSTYTGGAHPNEEFDGLLWDKATGTERDPYSLFVSKAAFEAAIRNAFCHRLDAERVARRKRDDDDTTITDAERCDRPFGVLILGSSNRQRFDRLGFLIAPYDAGPYVEGDYEVTLPITPAVIAAIKPEWRRYFKVAGTP